MPLPVHYRQNSDSEFRRKEIQSCPYNLINKLKKKISDLSVNFGIVALVVPEDVYVYPFSKIWLRCVRCEVTVVCVRVCVCWV